ncbi:MAG: DUF4394 domain-containing protein [Gammaproteobacteria bacterium]|nr:DUF4394 domain-containing protein [Gammaproteobacteria bacterium]
MALTTAAISAAALTAQAQTTSVKQGVTPLPARNIYALTSDNAIYVLRPTATQWLRLGRVDGVGGSLIGIDFRPADNTPNIMYGVTDGGQLFRINVATNPISVAQVSQMSTQFIGGYSGLMDFNPVANALRVAGANDQNLAVVNGTDGSNLSTTVAQTRFTYAAGDLAAGRDPEIVGGAYSNNLAGATATIFYMIDHAQDTLVTISTLTATGSSNTATGVLKTIGPFVDTSGRRLRIAPTTDIDIFTDSTGRNFLVGASSRILFTVDLSTVNPNLPVGQTQNVLVRSGVSGTQLAAGSQSLSGGIFDIAIAPLAR